MKVDRSIGAGAGPARPRTSIEGLFDPTFYLARYPDAAASTLEPLQHYLAHGHRLGREPNALFDSAHYRAQLRGSRPPADLVTHYVEHGAKAGLSPHPLFDPAHYATEAKTLDGCSTPLEHYLRFGWQKGLSPHALFDPEYYLLAGDFEVIGDPLTHYLLQDDYTFAPHYLFSDAVYVHNAETRLDAADPNAYRGGAPLVHYVQFGHRNAIATHPLFDPANYLTALRKWAERQPAGTAPGHIADPLRHYVETGAALGVSPSPYFDPEFFRRQISGPIAGDPLRAYLMPTGFGRASPHPAIDLDYYASRAGFYPDDTPSILHLLGTPEAERISPHPVLDARHYRTTYGAEIGSCPILHFIAHGMREDRSPSEGFSSTYVAKSDPQDDFGSTSIVEHYLTHDMPRRLRFIVVSHNATLTGAPGTALRVLEDFARFSNVECFAIVAEDGPRIPDFRRTAHTYVLGGPFFATPQTRIREVVRQIVATTAGNEPIAAIVNCSESRHILPVLAEFGIPSIMLVHEAADLYPAGAFDVITEASDKIVFGSQFVHDRAEGVLPLPPGRTLVRGQGLQQDHVGTMHRANARAAVRQELDLDDDVLLVLGCGTIDFRKGTDLFAAAALDVLRRQQPGQKTCFVWIGNGDHSILKSFVKTLVEERGHDTDVRFVGPRVDVEPYFMAADVFLMTSRVDPFPCVVQEAMACGLPIVAFREGGGAVEMYGDDAGLSAPIGNTALLADRVLELARDPELRQKLGDRGKALVAKKWRPDDYCDFLAGLVAEVAGLPADALGTRAPVPASDPRRVYLAFADWSPSPATAEAEGLIEALITLGYDARILLTRGRFAPSAATPGRPLPRVPYCILQPDSTHRDHQRFRTNPHEIWQGLLRFLRREQPAVVIAVDDDLLLSFASVLPSRTAIIGALATTPAALDDMLAVGAGLDAIVAGTDTDAHLLTVGNPALAQKLRIIAPPSLDEPAGNARESAKAYDRILRPLFDILVRTGSDRPLALGRDAFGSLPWTRERRAAAVAGHHHLPYPTA